MPASLSHLVPPLAARYAGLVFESGFVTLFRWRGVPILLHWTVPLGAVFVSGLRWRPGVWLGFILLVLFHEVGHALLVWRDTRATVTSIRLHGLGGECHYAGDVTARGRSIIAWGGVLAQGLLFVATYLLVTLATPAHPLLLSMLDVWLEPNLVLIALNLLPFPPLDGAEAWRLFGRLRRKAPRKRAPVPHVTHEGVHETVREALERAKREAREERERQR